MSESSDSLPDVMKAKALLAGVVVADAKGIIRSVNDHVCRLFGYSKKELLGHDIKIFMQPAYQKQHDHYMQNFLKHGTGKVVGTTRIVVGQRSNGETIKLRLALSFVPSDTDPLFCALMDELAEHTFELTADRQGKILTVTGDPRPTLGYSRETLIGNNVSMMMGVAVQGRHASYMKCYTGAAKSKIIGKVRNLEARHLDGHLLPISLEVTEKSSDPLIFNARITEVEGTTEAIIDVEKDGTITSLSDSGKLLFGYEVDELVGKHVKKISPSLKMKNGEFVASCKHKDGSSFFLNVSITEYSEDGKTKYRGTIRRVLSSKPAKKKVAAVTDEHIFTGDLLGWYEITKPLGSGYFGTVRLATHRVTGFDVAVKTLKRKQYEEAGMAYPPREIDLIRKLNHPNICRLYDTITTDLAIFMITEVVPGGELFDYVAQKEYLSEDESRGIMRQLIDATDYMHRSGIVHRDLKMENILLDAKGGVKIIDLGLGNFFDASGKHLLNTFCGSADYAAPELWRGEKYLGPGVDVWSLGVVLFVITTGFIPFNNSNHVMQIRYHWPKTRKYSDSLKAFVDLIFQPVESRVTIKGLIQHPWLNDGGKIPELKPYPLKTDEASLNEVVIAKMEELGFPASDVKKSILEDAHNQISTTYYLLQHVGEKRIEALPDKRAFESDDLLAPKKTDSGTPIPDDDSSSSHGSSSPDGEKHCIIA